MFPELLQKAGVRTLTAHAHFYFDQKAGFRQGFDVYEIVPGLSKDNTTDRNITSPGHVELATKILGDKANTKEPFFAWFHLLDPHDVYMAHPNIGPYGKTDRDKYDAEVTFVDQHLATLLSFVSTREWASRTAIIVTADHGEAFGEHKMYRHGFEIWDVLVHIPLLIQVPGAAPRTIDVPRSTIDLAPTILELTGTPLAPDLSGRSLVSELRGGPSPERPVIIDLPRTSDNDRRKAVVLGNYKLIAYGDDEAFELYDVAADPEEKKNLAREKDKKEVLQKMKIQYESLSKAFPEVCPKNTTKLKGKKPSKKC